MEEEGKVWEWGMGRKREGGRGEVPLCCLLPIFALYFYWFLLPNCLPLQLPSILFPLLPSLLSHGNLTSKCDYLSLSVLKGKHAAVRVRSNQRHLLWVVDNFLFPQVFSFLFVLDILFVLEEGGKCNWRLASFLGDECSVTVHWNALTYNSFSVMCMKWFTPNQAERVLPSLCFLNNGPSRFIVRHTFFDSHCLRFGLSITFLPLLPI